MSEFDVMPEEPGAAPEPTEAVSAPETPEYTASEQGSAPAFEQAPLPPYQQTPPQYEQQQMPPPYGQQQVPPPYEQQQVPPPCGQQVPPPYGQQVPPQYQQGPPPPYGTPMYAAVPPPEVCKWNWGAFCFGMWYGIGNKSYLPLLTLIPFFGIVWIFVCGACGMRWAWTAGVEKGEYRPDELHVFLRVQRTWNRAGFVVFWVGIAITIVYLIIILSSVALFSGDSIASYYLRDAFGLI